MRHDWLEDILAVLDTGSLVQASVRRNLTQPAFSRRIRAIEDMLGTEILDRTSKPAKLAPSIAVLEDRLRDVSYRYRDLVDDLRNHESAASNRIVIACQHAITTSLVPQLVKGLSEGHELSIRLRSENRDECTMLLFSRDADITLTYRLPNETPVTERKYTEEIWVGQEDLIPVFSTTESEKLDLATRAGKLPIISYPGDVFLGKLMNTALLENIDDGVRVERVTETALTLAALQLAIAGVGVAWVPQSLARLPIDAGLLSELSEDLPVATMHIFAERLTENRKPATRSVWRGIAAGVHR